MKIKSVMQKIVSVIVFVFMFSFSFSKVVTEEDSKQFKEFYNIDGSQNIYLVDTLRTSDVKLILNSEYQNHFALTDTAGFDSIDNLLDYSNAFVLLTDIWGRSFDNLILGSSFDNFIFFIPYKYYPEMWDLPNYEHGIIGDKNVRWKIGGEYYQRAYFDSTPSFYIMALIKGWLYNYAVSNRLISYEVEPEKPYIKPLDFCDEHAYYRMLIPVWEEDIQLEKSVD